MQFPEPNYMKDPLVEMQQTEQWLYAEALAAENVTGTTPLIERMRGRAAYLRNVREAIERRPTENPILPHEQQMVDGEWNR